MAYHGVPISTTIVMQAPWYFVPSLMKEINALRKINFAIVEQRSQALERFNNLCSISPVSETERFPAAGLYVCELLGDWPRKFQQLKAALSFRERDVRAKQSNDNNNNAPREVVNAGSLISHYSDAHMAFWNSTTSILDELLRADHVYDRSSFEEELRMDWH